MLLRYDIDGSAQLETIKYMFYEPEDEKAYFESDYAIITAEGIPPHKWTAIAGDMFIDGRLALGGEHVIKRYTVRDLCK